MYRGAVGSEFSGPALAQAQQVECRPEQAEWQEHRPRHNDGEEHGQSHARRAIAIVSCVSPAQRSMLIANRIADEVDESAQGGFSPPKEAVHPGITVPEMGQLMRQNNLHLLA